jgi:hypothetical protein
MLASGQWPVASGSGQRPRMRGNAGNAALRTHAISRGTDERDAREAREACDAREESMKGICGLAEARAGQGRAVSLRAVDESG